MDVSADITATLRAQTHGHPPVVCFSQSSFAAYAETPPCLRASGGDYGGGSESLIVTELTAATEFSTGN